MDNSRNCEYQISEDKLIIRPRPLGRAESVVREVFTGTVAVICLMVMVMIFIVSAWFGLAVLALLGFIAFYVDGDPVETVIDFRSRKGEIRRQKSLFSSILVTRHVDLAGCRKVTTKERWRNGGKISIPVSDIVLTHHCGDRLTLFTVYLRKAGLKMETDVDRVRQAIAGGLGVVDGGREQ